MKVRTYMRNIVVSVLVMIAGFGIEASDREVLLPIVASEEIPGAYGSRWISILSVTNPSSEPVEIPALGPRCRTTCAPFIVPPGTTVYENVRLPYINAIPIVLPLHGGGAGDATVHLRIQDLSRQSETWGTEIPVIDLDHSLMGRTQIMDLPPPGDDFRTTLRIVNVDGRPEMMTRVTVYDVGQPSADVVVNETFLDVVTTPGEIMTGLPGFIEVRLKDFNVSQDGGPYRIELEPIDPTARYWAFASITNNESQHVTISTPAER